MPSESNEDEVGTRWLAWTFKQAGEGRRSPQKADEMFVILEENDFFFQLMKHEDFRDGPALGSNAHIKGYRTFHYHKDASYLFKMLVEEVMKTFWSSCQKKIMYYVEMYIKKKIFDPGMHKATQPSELKYELTCPSRIWAGQSRRKGKDAKIAQTYAQFIKRRAKLLGKEKEERFRFAIDWSFRKIYNSVDNCIVSKCRPPIKEGFICCPLTKEACQVNLLGGYMAHYYIENDWHIDKEEGSIIDAVQRHHSILACHDDPKAHPAPKKIRPDMKTDPIEAEQDYAEFSGEVHKVVKNQTQIRKGDIQ